MTLKFSFSEIFPVIIVNRRKLSAPKKRDWRNTSMNKPVACRHATIGMGLANGVVKGALNS
jgi:hypothetical protein